MSLTPFLLRSIHPLCYLFLFFVLNLNAVSAENDSIVRRKAAQQSAALTVALNFIFYNNAIKSKNIFELVFYIPMRVNTSFLWDGHSQSQPPKKCHLDTLPEPLPFMSVSTSLTLTRL